MRNMIIIGVLAAMAAPMAASAQPGPEMRHDQREAEFARHEFHPDRRDRPAYVAPYHGWNYRPVAIGYRLQPAFYGPRYVIASPVEYRLPVAPRFHQWIRYGDDLVLVNARNGRVVEVIRGRY